MTTATLDATGRVGCAHLADGMFVRLSGALTGDLIPDLRRALLSPFASECRDVVVDAAEVRDVTDAALAVLVAANDWAGENGRRFLLSCTSPELDAALDRCGLADALPRLGPPAKARTRRTAVASVPAPRSAAE